MNKLNLVALLSLGVSLSLFAADTDSVRRLKEHFFAQANQRLQGAQAAFLAYYGLDSKGLDNPEMTEVLAQIIERDNCAQAKKFQSRSKRCLQACHSLCHPHQARTLAEQQAVLEAIAQRTFEDLGLGEVKIHHDAELGDNVGVMRCVSLNQVWVMADVAHYVALPERFAEVLWHEASHVVHQDTLLKQKLGCLAFTTAASNPERSEIEKALGDVAQACEMRSDAFSVLNSPEHGKDLIAVLEGFLVDESEYASGIDPEQVRTNLRSRIEILKVFQVELARDEKK